MNRKSLETEITYLADRCFGDYFMEDEAKVSVIDKETFDSRMKSFAELLSNTFERTYVKGKVTPREDIGDDEIRAENERLKLMLSDLELAFILQSEGVTGSELVRELSDKEHDIHDTLMARAKRVEEKEMYEETENE